MSLDPISAVSDLIGNVIDRIWPDATESAKAKLALAQMVQNGELAKLTAETDLLKGQLAVDQAEAASPSMFQHWRDGAGWICVAGFAYQFIIAPVITWIAAASGHPAPAPSLDTGPLFNLMLGMLGIGGLHVYAGVQAKKR